MHRCGRRLPARVVGLAPHECVVQHRGRSASRVDREPHTFRAIGSAAVARDWAHVADVAAYRPRGYIRRGLAGGRCSPTRPRSGLNGLMTTRLQLQASAQAARGSDALRGTGATFRTVLRQCRDASFAVTRSISAGVTYAYYNHRFSDPILLAPGFPPMSSQSVRAYVLVLGARIPANEEAVMVPGKKYKPEDYVEILWRRNGWASFRSSSWRSATIVDPSSCPNRYRSRRRSSSCRSRCQRTMWSQRLLSGLNERLQSMTPADPQPDAARTHRAGPRFVPNKRQTMIMEDVVALMRQNMNSTWARADAQ